MDWIGSVIWWIGLDWILKNGPTDIYVLYCSVEILRGNVLYRDNTLLCYGGPDTIDWAFVLPDDGRFIHIPTNKSGCESDYTEISSIFNFIDMFINIVYLFLSFLRVLTLNTHKRHECTTLNTCCYHIRGGPIIRLIFVAVAESL